jgi:perosamine synthetase
MYKKFVNFVQEIYSTKAFIPLHEPRFIGNEKVFLLDTIDSTFVSSVGAYVDKLERKIEEYTGIKHAIATVNGTAALHTALKLAGVNKNTEVITQSLTFVATCNAIRYCNAEPVFIDVDKNTLGLSVESLEEFLTENCELRDDGHCWNRISDRPVVACVPMHTFGFPVQVDELVALCERYNIVVIEDAAESLGSQYKKAHTGSFGKLSVLSFNGNKIIT